MKQVETNSLVRQPEALTRETLDPKPYSPKEESLNPWDPSPCLRHERAGEPARRGYVLNQILG